MSLQNEIDNDDPTPKPITEAEIRTEFSHHDPSVARINNGSFGCCPASIIAAQRRHQLRFLRQPDQFYFRELQPSALAARRIIQRLINARHVDEVSIVDNATTAAAVVLQHTTWSFEPGDAVILFHYAYGAVKKSVEAYITRAGGHVIEVHLPFPVKSNQDIVTEFEKALDIGKSNNRRIRLAIIDHITSMPSVLIPVKQLIKMCRARGVDRVFVDGAHAIGNVEIDVQDMDADFYTSNMHKWLFCPPSSAFLHRKTSEEDQNRPISSHEFGDGLSTENPWAGTRDYSAQLVLPDVMDFVARFRDGIRGIMKRNHERVLEMAEMLIGAWGTELGTPREMCTSMAMVGLPLCLRVRSESDASKLRTHLRVAFNVEVPIYYRAPPPPVEGGEDRITGYARISHQVYNVVEDYYRFRDAVNELVNDGFTCARLSK